MDVGKRSAVGYMPQVDGLRAVAIALVLAWHWLPSRFVRLAPFGPMGVRLFFVISGFLITGILLRARPDDRRDLSGPMTCFYARRFLRIFPPYYAVLAVAYLAGVREVRDSGPWHATYLSNFYFAARNDWHGVTSSLWSLAVEEQFYLLWPWAVMLVPRRWLPKVAVGMIVCGPVARAVIFAASKQWIAATVLLPSCLDSLGAGALLAVAGNGFGRVARALAASGVVIILVTSVIYHFQSFSAPVVIFGDLGASLLSAWLVWKAAARSSGVGWRLLEWKPVVWVGSISYGMYLYHPYVSLLPGTGGPMRFALPLMVGYVVALASLSYVLFERPILRAKRWFTYAAPATTAAAQREPGSAPN